jgi:hypothetical protein
MSKRRFGLVLVLMFAAAVAAAALYEDVRLDQVIAQERASTDRRTHDTSSAHLTLADLRGAQAAYFAVGQGQDFWLNRASDLAAQLERAVSRLQSESASPAAGSRYGAAMSALGSLNSLDQQARDSLALGQSRLAADIIFSEAMTSAERVAVELSAAGTQELAAREAGIGALRQRRVQTEAAAAGALLVAMLIGVVLGWRQPPATIEPAEPSVPVPTAEPARAPAAVPVARPELAEAAQVCVDLARLLDGRDLPPLLERAAGVLAAKGVVLWVADSSGAILRPSLAHGYSERVLQKLPPLQIDADNMTSLAFRSMQVQKLRSPGAGAGHAFAVPLITPTGCIGVLAAEIAAGPAEDDTLSLARMFAAQLATVVSPAEPEEHRQSVIG